MHVAYDSRHAAYPPPILEISLNTAVARDIPVRDTFGDTPMRTWVVFRAFVPRIVAPDVALRATDAPPRAAFETTAPRAETGTTPERCTERVVAPRETFTESVARGLCCVVDAEPRGFGAGAAKA